MDDLHSKSLARMCKENSHSSKTFPSNANTKRKRYRNQSRRQLLKQLDQQQQQIEQLNHQLGHNHDAFDELLDGYRFLCNAVTVMQLHGNFDDQAVYGVGAIVRGLEGQREAVGIGAF